MLSISVFLLLAGWKGVRGGLSQLIYHIKYQPSSISLSLSFSFPRLSLFSLTPFLHLLPFTSLLLTCPLHFFFYHFPVHSLSLIPSHFSLGALQRFSEGSHLSHYFLTTAICLSSTPPPASPRRDPRSLSLASLFYRRAISPYHVRFAEVQYA